MIDKPLYSSSDYLVLYKPSGLATVPLKAKAGGTFLDEVASRYPSVMNPSGKNSWEGGCIHRLDTPTSGLVLFALNQDAYDWIILEQNKDRVIKKYIATYTSKRNIDDGFEEFPFVDVTKNKVTVSSYFRAFGPGSKAVRPVYKNKRNIQGRLYTTVIEPLDNERCLCTLTRGFRHQVRAHMAWSGHPLLGDVLYGSEEASQFGLEAIGIKFTTPSGEVVEISSAQL